MHEQGAYDAAAKNLDDPKTKDLYDKNNQLLYWLDRGSIALVQHDDKTTIDLLGKAEDYMEIRREPSAGDELARWLINDTVIPYYGEPYENIYANVLKLLAQLESGNISGGATVEARRAAGKADWLRGKYLSSRDAVMATGDERFKSSLAGHPLPTTIVDANVSGEFIESTLGTYLTAITFMKDGESSLQEVAGRRLQSSIALQANIQPGVDASKFKGVGAMRPDEVNVLIVGLSGRGPHKVAQRIGPIPVYEWPVYFELPELAGGSQEVAAVRVVVDDGEARPLDKVEDMGAVAAENQRRQLPLIYARTLLRSQLKAAGWYAATQAAKNSVQSGNDRNAVQFGMILGGLAFMGATEKADLRCWTFLPGRADVCTLKLAPGRHLVRVEYLAASGGVLFASPVREVEVGGGNRDLATIVETFWR
jgi:hypothetical protein